MIEIFDDLFCEQETNEIENFLTTTQFPWYLSGNFTVDDLHYQQLKTKTTKEYIQFCHVFYDENIHDKQYKYQESPYFLPIQLILNRFPLKNISKIKANFQPKHESFGKDEHNTPHVDSQESHNVILYYVNESDGNTFIFNEQKQIIKKIKHKRGRLVKFDGKYYHAGSHPSKSDRRITINFNYKEKSDVFLL